MRVIKKIRFQHPGAIRCARHFSETSSLNEKHPNPSGKVQRPIFIAATKQHVGKTSVSLSLLSGLQKRFDKVGFIKPVGQQHVPVHSSVQDKEIRVDKDVCLMRERFNLNHIDYGDMSPVIIPRGYTKKFIEGNITYQDQLDAIQQSFKNVSDASDIVLCEGTGHCAVGSIVGVNNAQVASMIGADMVLVREFLSFYD